jgi:hypothetical protein
MKGRLEGGLSTGSVGDRKMEIQARRRCDDLSGAIPMALDKFWWSVKAAATSSFGRVVSDSPHVATSSIERRLRNAVPWLTPAAVEGFDPNDFSFLSPDEREELKSRVEEFRRVAATVPDSGPATDEQIRAGGTALNRILEILRLDENPDPDAFRASKILQTLRFPEVVKVIREFDTDAAGDPAIRVWVVLKDEVAEKPTYFEEAVRIRDQIDFALRRHGVQRWPYILFHSASEQRALERNARK